MRRAHYEIQKVSLTFKPLEKLPADPVGNIKEEDLENYFDSKEIDLTDEFNAMFERSHKSAAKSSQDDTIPRKRAKMANENQNPELNESTEVELATSSKSQMKATLNNNFSRAWSSKSKLSANISENTFQNPWAKKSDPKNIAPTKNEEPSLKPKSIPWFHNSNTTSKKNESSSKKLFNTSNYQIKEEQPHSEPPPKPPKEEEKKTPFASFSTGRQQLSWQEARKVRPIGLSRKQIPAASKSNDENELDPVRRKFQNPFKPVETKTSSSKENTANDNEFENPLLKGIDKSLLEKIKRDIVVQNSSEIVAWDDIAGLDKAKEIINHSIILPNTNPELYSGMRKPPRAFLLFGPPGSGKTLIGKCIANEGIC